MKICVFSSYYPLIKGGAEYQSKLLALEILKDHSVFFISIGHDVDEVIFDNNIKVYCLKRTSKSDAFLFYYPFSKKLRSILEREKPDLIYQRVLNSFSFHLANFAAKESVPMYLHIADNYSLQFDSTLRSFVRKRMFDSITKHGVKFITQTSLQTALLNDFGIHPVLQIPNMHTLAGDMVTVRDTGVRKILWIGSARKVKQLELFIKLAKIYEEDSKFEFVVIGRILRNEYNDELLADIQKSKNLLYLGEQRNDFINEYLKTSFVLVNTSVSEGFSNTFIQAWMRGIPVISLNSDPDGVIEKYSLGKICYGEFLSLKKGIDEFYNDTSYYESVREQCVRVSSELFSIEKNIYKLTDILYSK